MQKPTRIDSVGADVQDFLRASNELAGHGGNDHLVRAIAAWNLLIGADSLTAERILAAHEAMTIVQALEPEAKGRLREGKAAVEAPKSSKVPDLLDKWVGSANRLPKDSDEILADHVAFEKIHPFVDANGRIGRILLNWQRVKSGLDVLTIDRQEYDRLFEGA